MPQVDLETLVSACAGGSCSDRKIGCDDGDSDQNRPEVPPDFPPESFWLSKDAELDWFDRNAVFERKDSSKGTNSISISNSSSQRFSLNNLKSKTSIIGLPKLQKSCFVDSKNRRSFKPGNTRLFAKRSGSVSKSDASANEPSSPKVSCMGRVRSKKDRNRKPRNRIEPETEKPKPAGDRKTGFFATFRAIFRIRRKENPERNSDAPRQIDSIDVHDIRNRLPASDLDAPPRMSVTGGEPPGLGGMQRFTSGRRSGSWGVGELDAELAKPDSLDGDTMRKR